MSDRYYIYYANDKVIGWQDEFGDGRWYDDDYPDFEESDEVCVYYFKDNSQESREAIKELLSDSPGNWTDYLCAGYGWSRGDGPPRT